jgi:hypothetical protein
MGLTAMLVGSISGTGMHMMNNALQKVPLSRRESLSENIYFWIFVLYIIIAEGCFLCFFRGTLIMCCEEG